MPRRTTQFQQVVSLVKSHVASGATVTESKFLRDRRTGAEREVDVCVESVVAGHPITICLECLEQARKADVTWVEEMKAKHDDLPTNRLVLVSLSGFSEGAKRKAASYGIDVLAFESLDAATVTGLFGPAGSLWSKGLTLSPSKIWFLVAASDDLSAENVVVFPDNLVYGPDGQQVCTARDLVDQLIREQVPVILAGLGSRSEERFNFFELGIGIKNNDPSTSPLPGTEVLIRLGPYEGCAEGFSRKWRGQSWLR